SWPQWSRFLAVAFVGLLCAYIRPEFYISFLVASVMGLFFIWKQRAQTHARFISIVTSWLSGVVLLHALFGNPLMGGDDRSVVAFQQHFVTNYYYHWTNEPEPKTIEAQIQLFHRVLGNDVHSFKDALLKQPAWAFKHLWTNIVHTFTANLGNAIDTFYQTLFRGWYSNGRFMVGLMVLGLMLSLLDYRATWRQLRQKNWDVWGLVALLALLLPSLIATVLVYPRTHYLVFHLVLILWGLAFVSNRLVFRQIALPYINAQTVGFVVLGLYIFSRVPLYRQELPTPHADNVRYITSLKPNTRLVVLERYWYRVFLKEESTWIHVEEYTDGDFARFVQIKGVNFILMTQDMRDYFAQDTGFADFSRRASDLGFVKLRTNTSGDYLWVKRDVL
ncbi:MAG: hypothetical protein MUE30_10920, partial [Spirosomaceae bacterium]|nr:hypothetical protein [Spirosomataceae bacterium]